MNDTVTTKPAFGSVECFVNILRPTVGTHIALTGALKAVLDLAGHSAEETLDHVRNALAAAELLRAELAGR